MTDQPSRNAAYFEKLYERDTDPWQFGSSAYESAKYTATLAALRGRRFARALEVGCSIGVLTDRLAQHCDTLIGIDIAAAPLEQARIRCQPHKNVSFAQMAVPDQWPTGWFDLIVLSEVLYFLSMTDITRLAHRVLSSLSSPGSVLLVNWLGDANNPSSGDATAAGFIEATRPRLSFIHTQREAQYRLDLLADTKAAGTQIG